MPKDFMLAIKARIAAAWVINAATWIVHGTTQDSHGSNNNFTARYWECPGAKKQKEIEIEGRGLSELSTSLVYSVG